MREPLAPTLPECLWVVRAEQEAQAGGPPLVSVGFMRRFDPGYRAEVPLPGTYLRTCCCCTAPLWVSSALGATSESSVTGSAIHELDTVPGSWTP